MVFGEKAIFPAAQEMTEAPVSVVIPNWNGEDRLRRLLPQLERQSMRPGEIVVVDNGSTDGSCAFAESAGALVLTEPTNLGFASAVNRGIRESRLPLVLILNNDIEPAKDWLEHLVEALDPEPEAWFATGKILRASEPGELDGTWDLISRAGCAWRAGHSRPDGSAWNTARRIRKTSLTAALFRRVAFERAGPLDERFESYLEDVDFGIRCALAGGWGIYAPRARCLHEGSSTLGVWNRRTVRLIARNQVLLLAKHYPSLLLRRWWWPILVGQGLWAVIAARHGKFLAYLAGKLEGVRAWRDMRHRALQDPGCGAGKKGPEVAELFCASEQEIEKLQALTGKDWYWRVYFALT